MLVEPVCQSCFGVARGALPAEWGRVPAGQSRGRCGSQIARAARSFKLGFVSHSWPLVQVLAAQSELEVARHSAASIQQEYAAYKKYSSDLLKKEKEMNQRLRNLNPSKAART